MESKTNINREFYNEAYKSRGALAGLLHSLISYDQQSKSRRNISIVRKNCPALFLKNQRRQVMDYGFGHGSLLLKFPRHFDLFGSDISESAIGKFTEVCRLLRRKVTLELPTAVEEFVARGGFDIITCSHVLEHLDDDQSAVELFVKLLKPDGYLLINLPINEVWRDPNHVREYSPESAEALLTEHGFVILETRSVDRLTAFLLTHETSPSRTWLTAVTLRCMRLALAMLPVTVHESLETHLSTRYRAQQLIVLAQRRPAAAS